MSASYSLGVQAMRVDLELANRDSHRMFAASAWPFRGNLSKGMLTPRNERLMKTAAVRYDNRRVEDGAVAMFSMGKSINATSGHVAEIFGSAKGQALIDRALKRSAENMDKYIASKMSDAARKAARSLR